MYLKNIRRKKCGRLEDWKTEQDSEKVKKEGGERGNNRKRMTDQPPPHEE
jgi:hypothetical protein